MSKDSCKIPSDTVYTKPLIYLQTVEQVAKCKKHWCSKAGRESQSASASEKPHQLCSGWSSRSPPVAQSASIWLLPLGCLLWHCALFSTAVSIIYNSYDIWEFVFHKHPSDMLPHDAICLCTCPSTSINMSSGFSSAQSFRSCQEGLSWGPPSSNFPLISEKIHCQVQRHHHCLDRIVYLEWLALTECRVYFPKGCSSDFVVG